MRIAPNSIDRALRIMDSLIKAFEKYGYTVGSDTEWNNHPNSYVMIFGEKVKFSIYEGPRLIEKLTIGRTPEEDVSMSPRICAICSVSHKNAVLRAMENALDIKVSPKSYLLRELMHMGEVIESHSLHTFYLKEFLLVR